MARQKLNRSSGFECWQPFLKSLQEIRTSTRNRDDSAGEIIRTEQIRAVTKLTPWMMTGNLIGVAFLIHQGWGIEHKSMLVAWAAAIYFFALLTLYGWVRFQRKAKSYRARPRTIRKAAIHASVLGLLWGVVPSVLYVASDANEQLLLIVAIGGTLSGGAFALAVIPQAAYGFILTISVPFVALLLSSSTAKHGPMAFVMMLFAATLALIVSHTYQRFIRHLRDRVDMRRQSQIIGLLLKDFEESSSDWLWETDSQGNLAYVSDRYLKLVGKSRQELIGKPFFEVPGAASLSGWSEIDALRLQQKAYSDVLVQVEVGGEARWWSLAGKPMFDDAGAFEGYRGVGSDVTDSQRATEALRTAKEAAEQANAAKSQFLAMISHELRTPLNAIIGFSDLIAKEAHGPIEKKDYVEHAGDINESGRHLLKIINDLLDLARIDANQFQYDAATFEVGDLINSVLRITALDASKKSIKIDMSDADPTLLILGDYGRLRQVVINLLFNAIKFTPAGGRIAVSTKVENDQISLIIADTGPGIPEGTQDTLFEPFRQAHVTLSREAGGVGLGLPIARKLAEAHGGSVDLRNGDEGAVATLTIPLHVEFEDEAELARAEAIADAEFVRQERRALEDQPDAKDEAFAEAVA